MQTFRAKNIKTGTIIDVIDEGEEFYLGYPAMSPMSEGMSRSVEAYAKSAFEKLPNRVWRDVTREYLVTGVDSRCIRMSEDSEYGLKLGDRFRKVLPVLGHPGPYFIIERQVNV